MSAGCFICGKYETKSFPIEPIAELGGITLSHIAPEADGLAMKGRLLIEPKRHVVDPAELSPEEFSRMGILLQRAMVLLKQAARAEHVYFFRINEKVKHFHFHVLPRYAGTPEDYHGLKIVDWPEYPKVDLGGVQALSEALRELVKS